MKFEIKKRLANGLGRAGVIQTEHGEVLTPAFMVVGTQGYVRFIDNTALRELGAQAMLSNGYHLRGQAKEIAKKGGLASWSGWQGPTLTDSGGFQVMSLGSGLGKVVSMKLLDNGKKRLDSQSKKESLVQVSEKGVSFVDPFTGKQDFIGPEESMRIQCQIGADIHMAFDELTSLADSYEYNIEAMERTERWAERSLAEHKKHADDLGYHQNLYGVLQGGRWEDLRRATAQNLGAMAFDGFGLGGAFLKEDLGSIVRWCNEELPEEKPRHLLGLSHPEDIFAGVEMGVDTFDCVAPTREARHGKIYTRQGNINLRKHADDPRLLDENCDCATCRAGWSRGDLRALWRSGELDKKQQFYHLASVHNVRFIVRLVEEIREAILQDSLAEYKASFWKNYYGIMS